MEILEYIVVILIAYFLGNISPATLLAKAKGINIKDAGSGNAGTTNALRVMGKKAGLITLVVDILKGFIAVEIGILIFNPFIGMVCALAAFLGHIWPVLFRFRGGKGVAVAFGGILAVNWMIALSCLGIVFVSVLVTRLVSLGSIAAAIAFPMLCYFLEPDFFWIGLGMSLILIFKHRSNIVRLVKGQESKLSFKK